MSDRELVRSLVAFVVGCRRLSVRRSVVGRSVVVVVANFVALQQQR